ncbi:bifunctional DNA primase/polymerase [Roseateles sp. BYS87W]|uniref:Bifunctional DNA primase/polymerase n=1 Tax=Pelomonas baiyunensis TaxID=3299026 RepID=A0ABW7GZW3_9BURK
MKAKPSPHPTSDAPAAVPSLSSAVFPSPENAASDPPDRDDRKSTLPKLASSYRANALYWFGLGFNVIPVLPDTKKTAVKWDLWLQRRSPHRIVHHWAANPAHEIGFIVGDGLIVLDADSPKAVAALIEAECRCGALPSMIVQTRRGEHHYFAKPVGLPCKTTSMIVGEAHDRIDVKTGRTMVILPPSTGKFLVKFSGQHASEMAVAPLKLLEHFGTFVRPTEPDAGGRKVVEAPTERTMRLLATGLKYLPADCGYDTWLRIGAIIFNVSGGSEAGLELFDAWSASGAKYKGTCDVLAKWKTFRLDHQRPLRMATLRYMLAEQDRDWMDICAEAEGDAFQIVAEGTQ